MPTTPNATGLLNLEQTATELGTTVQNIKRLAAKGLLKATTLGENSTSVRVLATDLQKYVAAGAPNFKPPAWEGSWFQDGEYAYAQHCKQLITKAALPQTKPDDTIRAEYEAALAKTKRLPWDINKAQIVDVELTSTPEVIAAANTPLSKFAGDLAAKYETHFQALAVSRLRYFARDQIRPVASASLDKLYSDQYQAIVSAALAALKQAPVIVFSKPVQIVDGPERGQGIRVSYTLRFSALNSLLNPSKLFADAF